MNNETKRNDPFPDTSSTAETDWHKLIKTDDNPPPLFEERSELYPVNLLKRIEALEQENENMKVLLSLIFAITNRFKNKLFEPETWRVITEFAHKMGLQSIKFDMTDPISYQIIDNE